MVICFVFNHAYARDIENPLSHAEVVNIYTDLPKIGNWWRVPKGVQKITIYVKAKNTETVLFWLIPTGSVTWSQRKLIGYDKDGSDGWALIWKFGNEPPLQDHIQVQAIGVDTVSNWIINVTTAMP
jgi:hypothetical protein